MKLDEEIIRILGRDGWWVDLDTYIKQRPGETREAVYTRRSKGYWLDGVHCRVIKGAGLWVDLVEVNRWAAGKSVSRKASASDETLEASLRASVSRLCSEASSAVSHLRDSLQRHPISVTPSDSAAKS